MKANELRIGNYVFDRGNKVLKIDWLDKHKVYMEMIVENFPVHPLTEEYEYCNPVPLTEEWLKKGGYEWDTVTWSKPDCELMFTEAEGGGFCVFYGSLTFQFCITLEYVHEFQNIHSALGEELTINQS